MCCGMLVEVLQTSNLLCDATLPYPHPPNTHAQSQTSYKTKITFTFAFAFAFTAMGKSSQIGPIIPQSSIIATCGSSLLDIRVCMIYVRQFA